MKEIPIKIDNTEHKIPIQRSDYRPQTIHLKITAEGIECDWWTPEVGDIICGACKQCPGWKSRNRKIDCVEGNPYCG